jgi:predicted DNA-binding mobile mystery protein A
MGRKSEGSGARLRLSHRRSRLLRISAELDRWRERDALPGTSTGVSMSRPHVGWVRYIRDALNMSGFQLARRLNVRQPTLARLEQKEREETITLRALRRVANGLGCDLVYALVPRVSLTETIEQQARRAVTVALRDLPGAPAGTEELVRELLVRMPRWMWGTIDHPELFGASETGRSGNSRRPP